MPGNLAELRPLIFICAFVGMTVLLVSLMVSESPTMFSGASAGSSATGTDSTNPLNIVAWNQTYILNITDPHANYYFVVQGWNIAVECMDILNSHCIAMHTYDYWWIFNWNIDHFKWYEQNGTEVSTPGYQAQWLNMYTLDSDFAANKPLTYNAKNSKTMMQVTFAFNTTAYSKPSLAYSAGDLRMIFNMNLSERNTSLNALTFISGLFTFSLPGMPFVVNAIIWIMIFPALMYLSFIFVIKMLGAVLGGG
jgi:hypothetical protein